jgi:hypothetical protein
VWRCCWGRLGGVIGLGIVGRSGGACYTDVGMLGECWRTEGCRKVAWTVQELVKGWRKDVAEV